MVKLKARNYNELDVFAFVLLSLPQIVIKKSTTKNTWFLIKSSCFFWVETQHTAEVQTTQQKYNLLHCFLFSSWLDILAGSFRIKSTNRTL